MSLRNNTGQGVVTTLDKLNGNILLEQGPGMTIIDNPTTNSIRLQTTSQAVNLDTVLQNGDSSARTINLLTNVTDTVPTVTLHDKVTFGNSKRMPDVSIAYTDETPAGLKLTNGAIFRSDVIGASISPMIQSKSGITIDPGMTLKTDYIAPSTTGGKVNITDLQLAAGGTIYVDNILPNQSSPTRFINTGGLAVDPMYSVKASAYLPSGSFTNAATFRADDGTIMSAGTLLLEPVNSVQVIPNKLLKCDVFTSSTDSNDKLTFNMPAGIIGAPNILLNPVNNVIVQSGKSMLCDRVIDTNSSKMYVDFANTAIQASQDILQSDTQIQNFKTANISGLNADSGITINAPIGGVGLTPTTVLSTDTIHAVSTDNQVNFTSHISVDPKLHIKVKNVVSDSDILLNPVGDVVVDPAKILKTVNIRSVSDVVPITMSSDVNIGSIGTDTKTLNTDHIRPLTAGGRTDFSDTTMDDLKVATISPSVGGMIIDMNKASITSGTLVDVVADLKAASLDTDAISTTSTITGMNIDLVNSNIASTAGVTVSNIKSQDATFNSITPITKALAVNGDIKMIQDASVLTDRIGASIAQNVTVNNDMVINTANKLTATNIDAVAINNVNNPYGLRLLTDASTITSGSDILVTPNNLFKVYGPIQCDTYQPLTTGGDILLSTASNAKVLIGRLQTNYIASATGNNLSIVANNDLSTVVTNDFDVAAGRNINLIANYMKIDGYTVTIGGLYPTGTTIISNKGFQFVTSSAVGNALLNAYDENVYTGSFTNVSTAVPSFTLRFVKVGKQVTVTLDEQTTYTQIIAAGGSVFSQTIGSKYCSTNSIIMPILGIKPDNNMSVLRGILTTAGAFVIAGNSEIRNTQYILEMTASYCIATAAAGTAGTADVELPQTDPIL